MRSFIKTELLLAATALVVAACGGGGGYGDGPGMPANTAPTVSAIGDQSIVQDTSVSGLAVAIGDAESDAGALRVTATSSDTSLLPESNVVLGGSGANRTLTLTPAESAAGSATVAVTVTDPQGQSTTRNFRLTVNAVLVSFTGWTTDTFAVAENEASRAMLGFTLNNDADDNEAAFSALLQ
jgi:Bacterial Ig domain